MSTTLIHHPIGIFDSGVGGLTVARTIAALLPNEHLIYFGDTAHTPWGDKSTAAIQAYSIKICDFLLQHRCKCIVIACHTATTAAQELVREYVGHQALVLNVLDPVIELIRQAHGQKKIGLIGTRQTVRSNSYKKRIDSLNCGIDFTALATPLLVPLIEEGFSEKAVTEMIVADYLAHPCLTGIQALILGCTHYPLLKPYIRQFYQDQIDIIDAAETTAQALKDLLQRHALLNPLSPTQSPLFYVSDHSDFFANITKLFFPGGVQLEPYPLWE